MSHSGFTQWQSHAKSFRKQCYTFVSFAIIKCSNKKKITWRNEWVFAISGYSPSLWEVKAGTERTMSTVRCKEKRLLSCACSLFKLSWRLHSCIMQGPAHKRVPPTFKLDLPTSHDNLDNPHRHAYWAVWSRQFLIEILHVILGLIKVNYSAQGPLQSFPDCDTQNPSMLYFLFVVLSFIT